MQYVNWMDEFLKNVKKNKWINKKDLTGVTL